MGGTKNVEACGWLPVCSVSGTVTGPNGAPLLSPIPVQVFRYCEIEGEAGVLRGETVTDADGHFTVDGLPIYGFGHVVFGYNWDSENYYILGMESERNFDMSGTNQLGTVTLDRIGITGAVTGPDGTTPLPGIAVTAWLQDEYGEWNVATTTTTDDCGRYTLDARDAGWYSVAFADPSDDHLPEFYDDASELNASTVIEIQYPRSVVTGIDASLASSAPPVASIAGIDASLATTSKIVGTLSGPDGITPLPNIDVEAYRQDSGGGWQWMGGTQSDENGDYTLSGLPGGTYRVRFRDALLGNYVSEYYNGAADLAAAADIPVGAGATTTGISASLAEAGAAIPEIDVLGNAVSIADGDDSPIPADHTDYGSTREAGGVVVRTYVIMNQGNAPLTLSGNPCVTVSGTHAADFTVTQQPAASVAPGGAATFKVSFDPLAPGCRTATLSIANDDDNENPCSFAIQGKGMTPPGVLAPLREPVIDGFVIRWSSADDHIYALHHSTNLLHGFTLLKAGIPATPPTNTYTDHVQRATSKFWKITAE